MDGGAGRASKAPRSSPTSPSNPAIAEERGEKDDDKNDLHKCLKTALLSVVIVIVVLVLLLPTIVFFLPLPTPRDDGSQSNTSSVFILGSGSSGQGETIIQPPLGRLFNCSTLQCQEGFSCGAMGNTSLCLPVCGRWAQYPPGTVVVIDVAIILSAAIGVIASIAVLVVSCIRWKRMFTFPSVFVVYTTITVMITALFALITRTGRSSSLLCTSQHLIYFMSGEIQAVAPTSYCTLSGIVFYYGIFQAAVWWFCHVVSLFWGIRFPFHFRSFKATHRLKYVHITMVIVGLVLPTLPVILPFTTGDPNLRGFGLTTFPPTNCDSLQGALTFFSLPLPINLLLVTGIPLLIIVLWIIHKQHGLIRAKMSKSSTMIGSAERKLLIILCYYVLLVVISLTGFTVSLRSSGLYISALLQYMQCEATGVDPENPCNRASFEEQTHPALTTLAYVLLWIFPAVNLIFAVNISELKEKFKTWRGQAAKRSSSSETNTTYTLQFE